MDEKEFYALWDKRHAAVEKFKELLKERLPEGEEAMVNIEFSHGGHVTIHNGKGGINPRQRYLNKVTLWSQGKVTDRVWATRRAVARTDPNYTDKDYLLYLANIVNMAWADAFRGVE